MRTEPMQPVPVRPRRAPKGPPVIGWLTEESYAGMARRKSLLAYLFLLPTVAGILIFTAGPVVFSLALSFYKWDVINPAQFAGFHNYVKFWNDPEGLVSFRNTAVYVVLDVSLQIVLGLALALRLHRKMARWLRYTFRTIFFLPLITSGAAISVVMSYLFNQELGAINYYLEQLNIGAVPWLTSGNGAMITIVLTSVWQQVGFTFLVFTGGLGSISPEILDAADVDGAARWSRLWYITLPMLSPTLLFVAIVGVIGALQVFDQPYVLTSGGPGDATRTVVLLIYQAAFQNLQVGYGSAIAVLLFLVILAVTAAQFALSKRWVFYQ